MYTQKRLDHYVIISFSFSHYLPIHHTTEMLLTLATILLVCDPPFILWAASITLVRLKGEVEEVGLAIFLLILGR